MNNGQGILIVLSGMSGVGKETVCNRLIELNDSFWMSVSATTRPMRPGEVDGKDYFFITKDEFEKRISNDDFLEYAVVHKEHYYGTPICEIQKKLDEGKNVILIIDVQGAIKVKELIPSALFIFLMPPSIQVLKERLINRGTESIDKIVERFKSAYNELNEITKYNYVVINDEVDNAVSKIESIVTSEKCRVDRIEDEYLNSCEEDIHELLRDEKLFINHKAVD